ncbi:MAG: WGR domain-containing protein [Sulfitobacter litoralis]|jgi:predicted DNA-binding WGR domain protein|uniref:WGR domain-containing protein n=2 Tax=root TaxID=1 RepID=A0A7V1BGL2_9RHOB|nr:MULTISPECIES: WGR domain-containing protein [Sulfitobacter]MBQ0767396.1 WGR domain-containing protein [Sulfitobacter litoralis]MBQ0803200.1 WGR domain-containing protein [Sulfitobacter litoralis]MCF7727701.1 WGR domain-containing protein [Sulfitobacter sp. M22]MCF7776178.1 WGR domain-containing protein [Sulfitobacter sp. M220]HDY95882.1 WGR domain-containing protein [Sulfitobacter litoralis]|tara:strand:+ start:545 stop:772 length:228 start_codon:yes stop_codon:yes gene_type:complete
MIECLLYRTNAAQRRLFYRVEIAMNLFSEVSVLREWGVAGGQPKAVIQCFGNLREASKMADRYRNRAERRGYLRH